MAQASETQASGPLFGELEALFGSDKPPRPIYRDAAIRNLERELTSDINLSRGGLYNALSKYRRQQGLNNPLIRNATLESDEALRNILQRRTTPFDEYQSLGNYLFDKTQQVPNNVLNYLANSQSISNLARGIDPGKSSSYEQLLRGGIATRAGLDANRAWMQGLLGAFPQLQNAIQGRDQTIMSILPQRRAGFEALEARAMNPYMAQLAGLRDLQGLAMGQNALNIGNLQGYQPVQNWANRLGAAGRATTANINQLFDWAQQAASIYGSVMGGGMMGGMGGGGGGGLGSLGSMFGGGVGRGQQSPNPMGSARAQTAATAESVGPSYFPNYQGGGWSPSGQGPVAPPASGGYYPGSVNPYPSAPYYPGGGSSYPYQPTLGGSNAGFMGYAAKGTDFVTNGPQYVVAGEAGPERVTVTPLNRRSIWDELMKLFPQKNPFYRDETGRPMDQGFYTPQTTSEDLESLGRQIMAAINSGNIPQQMQY